MKELPLLRGDARRQWLAERFDGSHHLETYAWPGGYAMEWHTGWGEVLCGGCANDRVRDYAEHEHDKDYVLCEGELPHFCTYSEEGPPTHCDECGRVMFEGYEECDRCGEWFDTEDLDFGSGAGGFCEKCMAELLKEKEDKLAECIAAGGTYMGDGTDCATADCPDPCPADANDDGVVDIDDIFAVLAAWGPCP